MTLQEITALYFDAKALLATPKPILRVDGGDDRWYYVPDEGVYKGSVTTVIGATMPAGPALIEFFKKQGDNADEYRDERAAYGTMLHHQIERLLLWHHGRKKKGGFDMRQIDEAAIDAAGVRFSEKAGEFARECKKDLLAFEAFRRERNVKPIAIEICLSSSLGYAGAIDIVAEMDWNGSRKRVIIDVKSSKKGFHDSHEIQLHMYKQMWEENYPHLPVEYVFNWSPKDWRGKPTYSLKNQTDSKLAEAIPYLVFLFKLYRGDGPGGYLEIADSIDGKSPLEDFYQFTSIQQKMEAAP